MVSTASKPSKVKPGDVATNEALLAYADASRLARSWLSGGPTTSDRQGTDQKEEGEDNDEQQEDDVISGLEKFTQEGYSDNGGVGFVVPPNSLVNGAAAGTGSTSHDAATSFLRTQMLGKNFRPQQQQQQSHNPISKQRSWNQKSKRGQGDDDDDDTESRSHVGKSKSKAHQRQQTTNKVIEQHAEPSSGSFTHQDHSDPSDDLAKGPLTSALSVPPTHSTPPVSRKRAKASYLDELLAQRAAKKNKKANKSS